MAMTSLQPWSTTLCSCCDDCGSMLMACFCPCILYGNISEDLDKNSSCCGNCCLYCLCQSVGCCCVVHTGKRASLRARYGLEEDCCNDCCVTTFCACCALAQEAREMKNRGPPPVMQMGSPVYMQQPAPAPAQQIYTQQPVQTGQPYGQTYG